MKVFWEMGTNNQIIWRYYINGVWGMPFIEGVKTCQ